MKGIKICRGDKIFYNNFLKKKTTEPQLTIATFTSIKKLCITSPPAEVCFTTYNRKKMFYEFAVVQIVNVWQMIPRRLKSQRVLTILIITKENGSQKNVSVNFQVSIT